MKQLPILRLLLILSICLIASCRKPVIVENCLSKKVRYTIEGSYNGTLSITLSDNTSGNTVFNGITTPWKKEIYYGNDVKTIAFEARGSGLGNSDQTITVNIFLNESLIRKFTAVAARDGSLIIPTITYGL